METGMNNEETRRLAVSHMENGRNCAEAVFLAVGQSMGAELEALPARLATCFGGGVGKTRQELCGALAGGVMALGGLYGRDLPGEDTSLGASLAQALRDRFIARFSASRCEAVFQALGPQENWSKCIRLAGETAVMVLEVLAEAGMDATAKDATAHPAHAAHPAHSLNTAGHAAR